MRLRMQLGVNKTENAESYMPPSMLMSMPFEAAETASEKIRKQRKKSIVVAAEREEDMVMMMAKSKVQVEGEVNNIEKREDKT